MQEVVIRTKGDQTVLTINAPQDDVHFYGFAKKIDVKDVKSTSLHLFGSVNELQVEKGHVQVESTGIVFDVVQVGTAAEGTGASITNNGFIAETTLSEHTTDEAKTAAAATITGKEISDTFEVGTLQQLETFRDTVNAGNNFAGLTVKLTKDITLKDGWKPIGEGTRKVGATASLETGKQTYFAGTFDGNNKTISNLNNKGFEPTSDRLYKGETPNHYSYGLFALVNNATIKNLNLTNVDIDDSRYGAAVGDSVAALVGYASGSLTVTNVSVSGTIKATDAVAGIIGRYYGITTGNISNATNNASIEAKGTSGIKASGIIGYATTAGEANSTLTLSNNTNNGAVTSTNMASGILNYGSTAAATTAFTISGNTNNGQIKVDSGNYVAHIGTQCATYGPTSLIDENTNSFGTAASLTSGTSDKGSALFYKW